MDEKKLKEGFEKTLTPELKKLFAKEDYCILAAFMFATYALDKLADEEDTDVGIVVAECSTDKHEFDHYFNRVRIGKKFHDFDFTLEEQKKADKRKVGCKVELKKVYWRNRLHDVFLEITHSYDNKDVVKRLNAMENDFIVALANAMEDSDFGDDEF